MTQDAKKPARQKAVSVQNQFELLKQAVNDPGSLAKPVRDVLMPALASQGALAALELPNAGIVGMSLNTHKAIANEHLSGRYEGLNNYRKAALQKLRRTEHRAAQPRRGTIDWYMSELADRNIMLKRVANDIAFMSLRLDEVLKLAQSMAKEAGKEAEFNKRRSELLRRFNV